MQVESSARVANTNRQDPDVARRRLRVLWAGEVGLAREYLAHEAPHVQLAIIPSGSPELAQVLQTMGPDPSQDLDLLLLDSTPDESDPLSTLREAKPDGLHVPVVLLTKPGDDTTRTRALTLGISDYIVKTDGYLDQLLPTFEGVVARQALARAHASLRKTEARLRSIVESQPTCLTVIGADGRLARDERRRPCDGGDRTP